MKQEHKICIRETDDGRFVARSKIKGRFEVWRTFATRGEMAQWVLGEVSGEGSLQAAAATAAKGGYKVAAATAAKGGYKAARREAREAQDGQGGDAVGAKPQRTREQKLEALLAFVREQGGDRDFVALSYTTLTRALDMSDPAVFETIRAAVAEGRLIKETRKNEGGHGANWFRLPRGDGHAPVRQEVPPVVAAVRAVDTPPCDDEAPAKKTAALKSAAAPAVPTAPEPVAAARPGDNAAAMNAVMKALRAIAAKIQMSSFELQLSKLAEKCQMNFTVVRLAAEALERRGDITVKRSVTGGGLVFTLVEKRGAA